MEYNSYKLFLAALELALQEIFPAMEGLPITPATHIGPRVELGVKTLSRFNHAMEEFIHGR